jgi:cation diffusion facilitator CzcD-associated flavoprotein CzcO
LRRNIGNPNLLASLRPDYQIGCKRLLLSDDYFPALQQENVKLVTGAIDHFDEQGLVTRDGTRCEAELVVMATGFESSRLIGDMTVTGPDGLTLEQYWTPEIRAHRSVAVNGFPNFFMMYGPNSNLGHSSIIIMIEAQATYIARLLKHALKTTNGTVVVRPEAESAYNTAIKRALAKTVWNTSCSSWYKDDQGHIFSLWPHTTTRFIREMRRAPLDEYIFE